MTKNKFNLIPLNYKLALIAMVPILVLVFFFYKVEKEQETRIHAVERFDQRLDFSNAVNNFRYNVLMERRFSLGKLLDKNSANKLSEQRLLMDSAILQLDKYIALGELDSDYKSYTFVDSLYLWREMMDSDKLSFADIVNNYQKLNDRISAFSSATYDLSHKRLNDMLRLADVLSFASNYLATIRLNIYFNLAAPADNPFSFSRYNTNFDLLQSYLNEIKSLTKRPELRDYENIIINNANLSPILDRLQQISNNRSLDTGTDAEAWWTSSAVAVDELKTQQQVLLDSVADQMVASKDQEKNNIAKNRLLLLSCLAIVVILLFYVWHNIADHLDRLQSVAAKIALGHTGLAFPNFANDSIGKLALSMKDIDAKNQEIANAAIALGGNNYGVPIIARSEQDTLGNAMQQMKQSLYEHYLKDQRELWLESGKGKITSTLITVNTLDEFARQVLEIVADYLSASAGIFYLVKNEQEMEVVANLGFSEPRAHILDFAKGRSLIGKAYVSKNIGFYQVPHNSKDTMLTLQAGVSALETQWVMVVPIVHKNRVLAIMELASVQKAHKNTLDFVEQIKENIGFALVEIKNILRLKELLEETQAQTEELQAQHAELESLNIELETQASRLQASEEELRVQQAELLEINRQLEIRSQSLEEKNQIIIERNMDIRQKAETLERTTRYKTEFLANMSHELRTPLNSILLLSRLLTENHGGNLQQEQVEYASVIMNSGNSLLSLIDEILDLSKIESGKMVVDYEEVEVAQIFADMKALFLPLAKEKKVDLSFFVGETAPSKIKTDNLRLQQILRNLISNALKFTSIGSVHISVERHKKEKGNINFIVRDTGIGIPMDKQQLIFEAFQQADGSTRRKYGGTGLGLSISRELAKLLSGHLYINSEVTEGSEFVLTIPISAEEQSQETPSLIELVKDDNVQPLFVAQEEENAFASIKAEYIPDELEDDRNTIADGDKVILIIEDDTNFAKALMDFSHKQGYKVLSTVRGDRGISLARQYLPLAILLDIELPVKNGWEVMEEIKKDSKTRHIPVHIMSSHEAKKESISLGAIDFIRKPIVLDQITEVFRKIEEALKAGSRKVLILEENLKHAQALANYLQGYGVKTDIGQTIKSSIDSLKSQEVDCVILDMGIPDASAYKALETIKSDSKMENLPVIIFTGKNLSQSEEKKIKQYADSIVIKTAHSYERIMDEVGLFLHLVEHNNEHGGTVKDKLLVDDILSGKTVLIADDDVRNIFSLTKVLEGFRMEVVIANDGKEAIELLNTHRDKVNVVLMDMMMPEMDGYETISLIRKDPSFKKLPILAVTAKAMTGDREKCIAVGASDYISKPVDTDQLVSLLRVWLYNV